MDNTKILEQIKKLIEKSKEEKIPWKSANSNLVRWIKQEDDRSFTITLQIQQMAMIINRSIPPSLGQNNNNYVFTIQATNPNEVILQVNTVIDSSYKESLRILFNTAMAVSKNTSVEVIDKLLKDL
ncbi:MAG: hypothetical protein V4439_03050 [Patescibacteria group bacterium]